MLTRSGQAVNLGHVYLVKADNPDHSFSKKLEPDGSFKFEGVPVGDYYLVLNPRNRAPDESDAPYPRTYYPNVADPNQATKIVVTEGAKLENLTLRLGQPWKELTVSGTVVWDDGRSVQNAHISLYDGEHYVRLIKVDDKGRFNFKVYGDFKYAIKAETWGKNHGQSERVPLTGGKPKVLKLVLKPID